MEKPSAPQTPIPESLPELEKLIKTTNPPKKEGLNFNIIIIFLFAILIGGALAFYISLMSSPIQTKGCTMEAKICPDGSGVGRTGPNCDFAPCP